MKVLRLIFASFLIFVTLCGLCTQLFSAEYRGLPPLHRAYLLSADALVFCWGYYLWRGRPHWNARLRCPHCGHRGKLIPSVVNYSRMNFFAWIFIGWFWSLLIRNSRKRHFDCSGCGAGSEVRTPGGSLILGCIAVLVFGIFVFIEYPSVARSR